MFMNNPKVSVIIPVYNTEPWLEECLDSVLRQTMDDFEIVCVDDGSTDRSDEILREYAAKDARISVISQRNQGQSVARNTGLNVAQGKYIYFLDSDDYIEPDLLESACRESDSKNLDIVFFDTIVFGEAGINQETVDIKNKAYVMHDDYSEVSSGDDLLFNFLKNGDFCSSVCKQVVRRNFLEEHHLRFYEGIINEDDLYTFKATALARRASYIHRVFFHRRLRMNSSVTKPVDYQSPYGYFVCIKESYCFLLQQNYDPKKQKRFFMWLKTWAKIAQEEYLQLKETDREKLEHLPEDDKFLFQLCIADYANREEQFKRTMENEQKKTGLIVKRLAEKLKALEKSRSLQ